MRLIDADKLDFSFDEKCFSERDEGYCQGAYDAIGVVENAPTIDAVKVVRCKRCIHSKWSEKNKLFYCKRRWAMHKVRERDFCSYGVKKEDLQ